MNPRCSGAGARVTTDIMQQNSKDGLRTTMWARCSICGRKVRAHNGANEPGTFYAMHDRPTARGARAIEAAAREARLSRMMDEANERSGQ